MQGLPDVVYSEKGAIALDANQDRFILTVAGNDLPKAAAERAATLCQSVFISANQTNITLRLIETVNFDAVNFYRLCLHCKAKFRLKVETVDGGGNIDCCVLDDDFLLSRNPYGWAPAGSGPQLMHLQITFRK